MFTPFRQVVIDQSRIGYYFLNCQSALTVSCCLRQPRITFGDTRFTGIRHHYSGQASSL